MVTPPVIAVVICVHLPVTTAPQKKFLAVPIGVVWLYVPEIGCRQLSPQPKSWCRHCSLITIMLATIVQGRS